MYKRQDIPFKDLELKPNNLIACIGRKRQIIIPDGDESVSYTHLDVYKRQESEKLKKAIHTALAFGGVCGIFLTVAALILAPQILKLIGTPEEVLPKSLVYFSVYFAGSLGFVIYNFGMGILQSLGDSKSPVIYLIISACLNVILDLVLIGGLGFGVGAAAFATIVSQILSARCV